MKKAILTSIFIFIIKISFADELRDVRPPLDYPSSNRTTYLFICFGIVMAVLFILFMKHQKREALTLQSPSEEALEGLNKLKSSREWKENDFHQLYFNLSEILRIYLEKQIGVKAVEMTTEEFLAHMRTSQQLKQNQKEMIKGFLEGCDQVKFAKFLPDQLQVNEHYEMVRKFVFETGGQE